MEKETKTKKTTKSSTKSSAVKKTNTVKKGKVPKKTKELNETVKIEETEKVNKIIPISENEIECIYCHNTFQKGMSICPHCRKRQKSNLSIVFFLLFAAIFITIILCTHFIEKIGDGSNLSEEDYKQSCELVSYENLVRKPVDYKDKDIRIIGTVVEVTGIDTGLGNDMKITIDANLFNDGKNYYVEINYVDKKYEQGFINGDMITVYGKYQTINGNMPVVNAKYIVFGQ